MDTFEHKRGATLRLVTAMPIANLTDWAVTAQIRRRGNLVDDLEARLLGEDISNLVEVSATAQQTAVWPVSTVLTVDIRAEDAAGEVVQTTTAMITITERITQ